jgi:phosphatidylinositol alpha-1,6-mannosyltransferase
MKTLLLSEVFPPKTGGSGRWFWEIYRRLPRGEYVFAVGEDPRQSEFDATHDLATERLPLTMREWGLLSLAGLRGYFGNLRRLRSIVRRHGVSMVHCGRCLPEGVMALALKKLAGVPYLCYIHGEDVSTAANCREHAFLVRHVLAGAECCIANSRNTAKLLSQKWRLAAHRICVLNPGVDTNLFRPAQRCDAVRRKFGWENRRVVLTVGRLQQRKGQDMLIRALPAIKRKFPDVLYAIVGDGEQRSHLEQLARQLDVSGQVQFRGETTDEELIQNYQQCDLFALPNREIDGDIEGFGMVLAEAQACGKPVIAGDSGGTAETMRRGVTGYVVDCRTPEPLAGQIVSLLDDPARRDEMGSAARNHVVELLDWDALAGEADALFSRSELSRNLQAQESAEATVPARSLRE